ncbi:hypothetical protein DsansV1_C38g0235031 [Dioscorea sansibarensis]
MSTTTLPFSGHRFPSLSLSKPRRNCLRHAFNPNSGGSLVDENMIVLRKRIHEMKMQERNYEPPNDWMEWEKKYYTTYESDVCEVVGLLQTMLMNTRPCVAIGFMFFILLSLPTSCIFILVSLFNASKSIL